MAFLSPVNGHLLERVVSILGSKSQDGGAEIIQDGDKLNEHYEGFLSEGSYKGWISGGILNDWLLMLDFRGTQSQRDTVWSLLL